MRHVSHLFPDSPFSPNVRAEQPRLEKVRSISHVAFSFKRPRTDRSGLFEFYLSCLTRRSVRRSTESVKPRVPAHYRSRLSYLYLLLPSSCSPFVFSYSVLNHLYQIQLLLSIENHFSFFLAHILGLQYLFGAVGRIAKD